MPVKMGDQVSGDEITGSSRRVFVNATSPSVEQALITRLPLAHTKKMRGKKHLYAIVAKLKGLRSGFDVDAG
jgi:hypothetical protein